MKLYTFNTPFDFGKFEGETLETVCQHSPNYVAWCLINVSWFCVNDEVFKQISEIQNFTVAENDFTVINNMIFTQGAEKLESYHSNLIKLHNEKTRLFKLQVAQNFELKNRPIRSNNDTNWLEEAAGTDDPEIINDVYWNLD